MTSTRPASVPMKRSRCGNGQNAHWSKGCGAQQKIQNAKPVMAAVFAPDAALIERRQTDFRSNSHR